MEAPSQTYAAAAALRTLADLLFFASQELRALARRVDRAIAARREQRLALEQLGEMSDRELKDIGLDRASIRATAAGTFRRDVDACMFR